MCTTSNNELNEDGYCLCIRNGTLCKAKPEQWKVLIKLKASIAQNQNEREKER